MKRVMLMTAAIGVIGVTACKDDSGSDAPSVVSARISIVSVDTPEARIAAEIYAQALSSAGFRPARKDPVATRAEAYEALSTGRAQLIVDFAGDLITQLAPGGVAPVTTTSPPTTAATTVPTDSAPSSSVGDPTLTTLGLEIPTTTTVPLVGPVGDQIAALKRVLPTTFTIGAPADVSNANVVACSAAVVAELAVDRLTTLQAQAGSVRLAAPQDIVDALDADFEAVKVVDATGGAAAIKADEADCAIVSALNPEIALQNLTVLTDDIELIEPNALLPVLTTTAATPEVLQVLDAVSPRITAPRMAAMIGSVVNLGQSPDTVAKSFLGGAFESVGVTTTTFPVDTTVPTSDPAAPIESTVPPTVPPGTVPQPTTTVTTTAPDDTTPST